MGVPGCEGAGGRGHGAVVKAGNGVMVQAGKMVEPCRVRKGDGMLLHMGTWSHPWCRQG